LITNILPTPIYTTALEIASKAFLQGWVDAASDDKADYNGYYVDNQLHRQEEFSELTKSILEHADKYIKELQHKTKDGSPYRLAITRMWATQFNKSKAVVRHCHAGQGAVISGVYYMGLPSDVRSGIEFFPRYQPFVENIPFAHGFSDVVEVGENLLIMFPGELMHTGVENVSDQKRINIAFDITYCDSMYGPIL